MASAEEAPEDAEAGDVGPGCRAEGGQEEDQQHPCGPVAPPAAHRHHVTAQGLEVFQRASASAPVRRAKVPGNVAIVSDAGFDEFVRKHWAELEAGRTVRFPFLVPSRLDFLTFKVKKHHEESIEGATASVIRLNLSGVLGWFLPYIEVSYRKSDRVLMRYKGLTNVRDTEGNNLVAQIDFPSRERQTVPAVDLAAQKAVKLVSRCPG